MPNTARNMLIAVMVLAFIGVGWYVYEHQGATTFAPTTPTTTPAPTPAPK
jgi:cbb3-type cytochrome oxidase subunit 3